MRRLTTALTLGMALLLTCGSAGATTPGPVCRAVCAPRVAEQCAGLTKRALRKCRRPLVQACKQTAPEIACSTMADLVRRLEDRLVIVQDEAAGTSRDITLCAAGDFKLRELLPDGTDAPNVAGQWTVRIVGGALVLDLDGGSSAASQLRLEPDGTGDLLVDGLRAVIASEGGACAPSVAGDDPEQTLIELARKLADRTLAVVTTDGTRTTKREITFCSAGTFTETILVDDGGASQGFGAAGTWTLRVDGRDVTIELEDGSGSPRSVPVGTSRGGQIVLDGEDTDVRDARGVCEGAPVAQQPTIEEQLEAALRDTAFAFTEPSGIPNVPTRVKIGLCASGRQVLLTTATRQGSWIVRLDAAGQPALELNDDAGNLLRSFLLSFGDDGKVLLDGVHAPVDEPSLLERACQS